MLAFWKGSECKCSVLGIYSQGICASYVDEICENYLCFALLDVIAIYRGKKETTKPTRHVVLLLHARDKQRPKKILLYMNHLV